MVVCIDDENIRKDIRVYLKVSGIDDDKLEVTIEQQEKPFNDIAVKDYYVLDLPQKQNTLLETCVLCGHKTSDPVFIHHPETPGPMCRTCARKWIEEHFKKEQT